MSYKFREEHIVRLEMPSKESFIKRIWNNSTDILFILAGIGLICFNVFILGHTSVIAQLSIFVGAFVVLSTIWRLGNE